jgi:hypothetical protein
VTKADFDRADAAFKIAKEASDAMHATVPQTVGGVRALLQYANPSAHTLLKSPIFASIMATEV